MFRCSDCFGGYLRAVTCDISQRPNLPCLQPFKLSSPIFRRAQRKASTTAARLPKQRKELQHKLQTKDVVTKQAARSTLSEERVMRRPGLRDVLERRDPLILGDKVRALLRNGKGEDAYALVQRASSRKFNVTVAWNYIIGWELQENRIARAWKAYQDMKKRGQRPDSYTFTVLFSGLAQTQFHNNRSSMAMEKAMIIYNSLFLDKSPLKGPSAIHLNAILSVCQTAKDVTAMWEVINKLPTHKERDMVDHITFTTILNTLYAAATNEKNGLETGDKLDTRARYNRAIRDGRKVWIEAVGRWKNGQVKMDSGLVASMGRLLLLGGDQQSAEDVLLMVSQAVRINHEKISSPRRKLDQRGRQIDPSTSSSSSSSSSSSAVATSDVRDIAGPEGGLSSIQSDEKKSATSTEITESLFKDQFEPVSSLEETKLLRTNYFADPDPQILSLVLVACLTLGDAQSARHYWNAFTKDGAVRPDSENAASFLRVLRLCRDSQTAAELIETFPLSWYTRQEEELGQALSKDGPEVPAREAKLGAVQWPEGFKPEGKLFMLAMTTCRRNSTNPSFVQDAVSIRQMLRRVTPIQDPRAMKDYITVLRMHWKGIEGKADVSQRQLFAARLKREMDLVYRMVKMVDTTREASAASSDGDDEDTPSSSERRYGQMKPARGKDERNNEAMLGFLNEYRGALTALIRGWNPSIQPDELRWWKAKYKNFWELAEDPEMQKEYGSTQGKKKERKERDAERPKGFAIRREQGHGSSDKSVSTMRRSMVKV